MSENNLLSGKVIGIVCQYYPPETGAASSRAKFLTHWASQADAKMIVVTAMPNYPEGKIHSQYAGKLWVKQTEQWGMVLRSWCYARPGRSTKTRLLNYFSFMILSFRWILELRKCDVIVFSSGPMFAGMAAFLAGKLFKIPVVLDARDLWPDRIWDSGAINLPAWVMRLLKAYEQFMYKNSVFVTAVTKGVASEIEKRVSPDKEVFLLRNCNQEVGVEEKLSSIKSITKKDVINIIEAGTLGWTQDPITLCQAFKGLQRSDLEYQLSLDFAGTGPRTNEIEQFIAQHKDQDIRYVGNLSADDYWNFLESADIGIVTLKNTEHNKMTVSRRIFDYAKSGLAIVYCGAGEGAELIKEVGAGLVVTPENGGELKGVLQQLINSPDEINRMKAASRNLLEGELSSQYVGEKFVEILAKI